MTKNTVLEKQVLRQEIRTPAEKFGDWLKTKHGSTLIGVAAVSPLVPPLYNYAGIIYTVAVVMLISSRTQYRLPVHLPIFAKQKLDYNNLKSKTVKGRNIQLPDPPAGVLYVGNMQDTNEQVWWDKPLACTHLFFLATTGGGKTYSFSGILASFVIYSGFVYSDAKADLALVENYARMMWRMGRINQLYVLSFQAGNRSPWMVGKSEKLSHTFNPAANGSAPMISELFKSLLDGEGDIWAKRGDNLSTVLIRPLTYMRDKFKWPLGFGQIASYFSLEKLGHLCGIAQGRNVTYKIVEDDKKYFAPLIDFIKNIPGITEPNLEALFAGDREGISKITTTVRDQLGYVTMQLVNVTNDLVGDYGHIFETMYGQINLEDALTNRKVVITLLPALERSESTMSVLGRITLAAQKTIVANSQAFKLEGELSSHIATRPTAADVPFASVNDEAGSFMVEGVSANTAMARSANVMFAFGGQDLAAMKKRGGMIEKEIDTIWGTTVNKMAGSVLESSTVQAFIEAADEENHLEVSDFELDREGLSTTYRANRYTAQSRKVLTAKMLANQEPGQVQLLTRGTVRALTLPNYMTKGLQKKIVNFYLTETIPIIPMKFEDIATRKGIVDKLKTAIKVSGEHNVFAETLKDSAQPENARNTPNNMLDFMVRVNSRFQKEAYNRYTFFIAATVVLFYIEEHAQDTLRSISLRRPTVDESLLTDAHRAAISKLFVRTEVQEQFTEGLGDDGGSGDDHADEYDSEQHETAENDIDAMRESVIDDAAMESFLGEVNKALSEDHDDSTVGSVGYADSMIDAFGTPPASVDPESLEFGNFTVDKSVADSPQEIVELNLGKTRTALHDISDILSDDGIGSTQPSPVAMRNLKVDKAVVKADVDDDIAALDAIRVYTPEPIATTKNDIAGALTAFLESIKSEDGR